MKQQVARFRSGSPSPEPAIILGSADLARLRAVVEKHLDGPDRAAAEQPAVIYQPEAAGDLDR